MAQKKLPIILERKEIEKLLDQPSKTSLIGLRNRAIMKIMLNLGLRVSEVTNLKTEAVDLENGKVRIIQGKGGRDRNLATPETVIEILKEWKKKRPQNLFFFPTLKGTKLCSRYLQQMIKRYAAAAGIKKRITPHILRHIFATDHYRQYKDIMTLKSILGHEFITTTTIYITLANIEVEKSMRNFIGF